jgi:glucose/arabinose dehydrogenase
LCSGFLSGNGEAYGQGDHIRGSEGSILLAEDFGTFSEPWAMVFLPDGNLLVTEKSGSLYLFNRETREKSIVEGVPSVAYGGQGGLGDVILHPQYQENRFYLSLLC